MTSTSGENATKLRLRIPAPARGEHPPDRVRYISRAGEMQKPALDEKVERIALMRKQLVRVLDDDGQAVGEWVPEMSVEDKVRGLRDMMLDARVRRPSAACTSTGQDVLLHAVPRRRSDRVRATAGAATRRHALPHLPPAGTADLGRVSTGRHDEPGDVERVRPVARPPVARDVLGEVARLLLDLRQPRDAVHPGRRLGDGVGAARWHGDRIGMDRRGRNRRIRLPRRARVRIDVSGAGHLEHRQQPLGDLDTRGLRTWCVGDVRRSRLRLQHPCAARRWQRLPRGVRGVAVGCRTGPDEPRTDADRVDHPARRGALDIRRPFRVPTAGRGRELSARRPGAADAPASRGHRRMGRAPATRRCRKRSTPRSPRRSPKPTPTGR